MGLSGVAAWAADRRRPALDAIDRGCHLRGAVQLALRFDSPPRRPARPLGRASLEARIRRALGVPADLIVTDNRRTMIATRHRGPRLEIRLHHMFLDAPSGVIEELLSYLADGDRRASAAVGRYIEANRHRIKRRGARVLLRTRGRHHDLDAIAAEVGARYFEGAVDGVRITWGRKPPQGKRRRSIRLGTYTHDQQLVRIHPSLDQAFVPRFFVEFVVFHELLHHVVPPREVGGRLEYHTPEFRRRERAHPDYRRAVRWENENLSALLKS